jgi:hypothetical protein
MHAETRSTRSQSQIVRAEALPDNVEARAGLSCPSPAGGIVRAEALPDNVKAPAGLSWPSFSGVPNRLRADGD